MGTLGGVEDDAVVVKVCEAAVLELENLSLMHCCMCASLADSPTGISLPHTGHSSSSFTWRLLETRGGLGGAVGRCGKAESASLSEIWFSECL